MDNRLYELRIKELEDENKEHSTAFIKLSNILADTLKDNKSLREGIEYWLKSAEESKTVNPESDGYFQLWQIQKLLSSSITPIPKDKEAGIIIDEFDYKKTLNYKKETVDKSTGIVDKDWSDWYDYKEWISIKDGFLVEVRKSNGDKVIGRSPFKGEKFRVKIGS